MGNSNRKSVQKNYAERDLKHRSEQISREFKILILGSGESGKSTIFKQVKILKHNGYDKQELMSLKRTIYFTITVCMGRLVRGALQFGYSFYPENQERVESMKLVDEIVAFSLDFTKTFGQTYGADIAALWLDPAIQMAFDRRSELHIEDGMEHFMRDLDRIRDQRYRPTENDILYLRQKTIGVVEMEFEQYDFTFRFIDVGGQRNERRKWIHQFGNVAAVMYVVSLSDYNQNCTEDNKTSRMSEALSVFESTLNNPIFKRVPIILLFNKYDLFVQKLDKFPMYKYFPNYKGGSDPDKACQFIKDMFLYKLKTKKSVYEYVTCATDTTKIQHVLQCVEEIVFKSQVGGFLVKHNVD